MSQRSAQPGGAAKSSVDEIRRRFDADVERFSHLETGQSATIDAPLAMELVAEAASLVTPGAEAILDIGCGAGNYTLRLLQRLPGLKVTLIDLSRPMLERAMARIGTQARAVQPLQGDMREIEIGRDSFDIVLAAAVLHHLRDDTQWRHVFNKIYAALRPGGSFWIFDLVTSSLPAVSELQWRRWGEYLTALKDAAYRDAVFACVDREDTPRSLADQLGFLREAGFGQVEVLHVHGPFAAFGAAK